MQDSQLVSRVAKGDQAAFQEILEAYSSLCFRIAWRFVHSQEKAEDIVQEAFLALWKNASSYNPHKAKLSTWLVQIVINKSIDYVRKLKNQNIQEIEDGLDAEQLRDSKSPDAVDTISVHQALLKLDPELSTIVNLCFYEGYSYEEAAGMLDKNAKYIENALAKAKKLLKRYLDV